MVYQQITKKAVAHTSHPEKYENSTYLSVTALNRPLLFANPPFPKTNSGRERNYEIGKITLAGVR